jgi:YD repeat-containing protein
MNLRRYFAVARDLAAWRGLFASTLLLWCLSSWVVAQGPSRYVYDDDRRLRAVIAPSGQAAVYEYDAAGNFTAIRRLNADDLELLTFAPRSGIAGTRVVFYGVGFGAGVSTVTFGGGAVGTLVGFTNSTITAVVPTGAVTGPVTIATARGQLTTATPFVVQGIIVNPVEASVVDGGSIQFSATVMLPGGDQQISWSVNGVEGGSATLGRITGNGFYTAPPDPPASFNVSIQAASVAFPEITGLATVHVRSLSDFRFALSTGVSVGKGPAFPNVSTRSQGVSIGKGAGYAYGLALSDGVSLTKGPIISAIAPSSIARGSNVTVTLSGSNLSGTTAVLLFNADGSRTSSVTVSNIVVSGDGNSLTMNLIVGSDAPTGRKVIVAVTPLAHSVISDVNVNTFQITGP